MRHVFEVQLVATSQEVCAYGAVAEHYKPNVRLRPQPVRRTEQEVKILLAAHVACVHDRESPSGHEAASKLVLLPRNRGQLAAVHRIRDDSDLVRVTPRSAHPPS